MASRDEEGLRGTLSGGGEAAGKLIGETLWGNRLTNKGHHEKGKSPTVWRDY